MRKEFEAVRERETERDRERESRRSREMRDDKRGSEEGGIQISGEEMTTSVAVPVTSHSL